MFGVRTLLVQSHPVSFSMSILIRGIEGIFDVCMKKCFYPLKGQTIISYLWSNKTVKQHNTKILILPQCLITFFFKRTLDYKEKYLLDQKS